MITSAVIFVSVTSGERRTAASGHAADVCTALENGSHDRATIRGTGRITPDGFVLGDRTCPVVKTSKADLPSRERPELRGK
jgi:hypothetical protein